MGGSGYMDELVLNRPLVPHDPLTMAERELSAFFTVVTDLFGSEQAQASAEDWLDELMACNDLPASARQWRTLTVMAAARLASRVNASNPSRAPGTRIFRQRRS
jgi:hypothetical protein